ncbi:MAG: glycosyltransferase family 4 protein [Candidatus Saccharimonadales bacterium]
MKVLMLGWELPPHNSGGLGVACYQMCKEMVKHGLSIEFIVPYTAQHNIDFMKVTAATPQHVNQVIRSGIAYDSYKFINDDGSEEWVSLFDQHRLYEKGVEPIAKLGEFDIIHAHDWLTFRAGMKAKQLSGKPLIVHIHATEYDRAGGNSGNPVVEEVEYMGMMLADRIIAVSNHTKQVVMRHYGIPANKIEVVHNSIDVESYAQPSADNLYTYLVAMKAHGWRVVSNVGRMTVQKGLVNLLTAMQGVIARAPKTLLMFVGSGEQYTELIELAAQLGISANVLFVDFQRGQALRDAFAISDLFVMPSVSEPFGIAPLEAIAFGTPTLISKQSGVAEVVRNCLKVDFWDIDEMVNQITAVVQNDVLRDELHQQSYLEFSRMNWYNAAHKMKHLYEISVGAPA